MKDNENGHSANCGMPVSLYSYNVLFFLLCICLNSRTPVSSLLKTIV